MNKLNLSNTGHENRRYILGLVYPLRKLPHKVRNIKRRRRSINNLTCAGIDNIVLNLAVIARVCILATDAFDENFVKLPDDAF